MGNIIAPPGKINDPTLNNLTATVFDINSEATNKQAIGIRCRNWPTFSDSRLVEFTLSYCFGDVDQVDERLDIALDI